MWLSKLKTALVLEDTHQIALLIEELPPFGSHEEMEQASCLLAQAIELVLKKQQESAQTMKQIKSTLDFLKSTHPTAASALNIKL